MTKQAFTCDRDGLTIRGMAVLPEGEEKRPAVIVCHGYSGCLTDNLPVCERLAAAGFAAFTFSFCGGSRADIPPEAKSDGDTTAMSLRTEREDLLRVIAYAAAHPRVDPARLSLMGYSQGGTVAGITAGFSPVPIHRLVMVFPALCIPDHARRGCLGGAHYDPADPPEVLEGLLRLGRAFHEEAAATDIYLDLERYAGPVLILHGTADQVVDYTYSVRANAAYRPGQSRLLLVRDMGHGGSEEQMNAVLDSAMAFLRGQRPWFSVRVVINGVREHREGDGLVREVFFTGWCDSELFKGAVQPGACDTQRVAPSGETTLHAVYTLSGVDAAGEACTLSVVNSMHGGAWKPQVRCDSPRLQWMNTADWTAVLEHSATGPTVRFFADERAAD